jgi:tripartite-type tricarboxylate transporter receptor subunit TctC
MTTLPYAQTGKLRTLAVSSLKRSPVAPQVPTMAESGYPGYEAILWFGLFAPAGTPPDIIRKVNEETARGVATPKMRELLTSQGLEIVASSPNEFAARVDSEIVKWRKVILEARIRLDE